MKQWFTIKAQADDTAEITIFDSIGASWDGEGVTAKAFIDQLKSLTATKITLLVNSPGGSVFDGLAIYNALLATKAEVTAKVMGVAASAASFIVMAAKKIVMPENSFMMIHNPSTYAFGNAADMREAADWLDKIGDTLANVYATRSGKSLDEIKALLAEDTWFTAQEAKDMGLADEVDAAFAATACFEVDKLPENVRKAFASATPPKPVPPKAPDQAPPLSAAIARLAREHSLPELGARLAVDPTIVDVSQVQAAFELAVEVKALGDVAGLPDQAKNLVLDRVPLTEARAQLCEVLAAQDRERHVDTTPPAGSSDPKPKPVIDVSAIYAKANAHNPLTQRSA